MTERSREHGKAATFEEWWASLPPLPAPPHMADGLKEIARYAWNCGRRALAADDLRAAPDDE